MNRRWLRQRYRKLPSLVQRILVYEQFRSNIPALRRSCGRFPRIYALRSSLTDALLRANREKEAYRVWRTTVRMFPRAPNPYFQFAHWALEQGAFGVAAKYLKQCLVRDRGYFRETAHFWRAEALFRVRRFNEAIAELSHVGADFEEQWFLGYRSRSKADILNDIKNATTP
jgi:tetratricopeptide (TPR) repeat protein